MQQNKPTTTLNIIGPGRLGRTLGRLMADSGLVTVASLYSRDPSNARNAGAFIRQGAATTDLSALADASLWLIATPDDAIADVAQTLAASGRDWRGCNVFHCSGIHSAQLLRPLQQQGASIASLHPIHSFADPQQSLVTFAGSCCTLEGDPQCQQQLTALFSAIGARLFAIDGHSKALYHTATAMASNYLVALMDISLGLLEKSAVNQQDARELLAPLVMQTAGNIFAKGPQAALSGPIVRGDSSTVQQHLQALEQQCPELLTVYRELGLLTLKLAAQARPDLAGPQTDITALLKADPSTLQG